MQPALKQSPEAGQTRQFRSQAGAVLLVFALLALHLIHGLFRRADPDEFQTLVNAVLSARGRLLYLSFWDNHGPLMTWTLTPLVRAWTGGYALLLWLRGVMWLNTIALCALVFFFTRALSREKLRPAAPWVAVIMLLLSPPFMAKSIELRPDAPANLLGFCGLIFLYGGIQSRRLWMFALAGLCTGVMAGFTLKAAMVLLALSVFWYLFAAKSGRWPRALEISAFGIGAAAPLTIIAAVLLTNGTFPSFLRCYLAENLQRELPGFTSSELTQVFKKAPVWCCIALAGIGAGLWKNRRFPSAAEPALAGFALVVLLEFALLLPTKYYQSLLPVYPCVAILTGLGAANLYAHFAARNPISVAACATVLLCLLLADLARFNPLQNSALRRQIRFSDVASTLLPPHTNVFDPGGSLYLAPRTGYYPVLVKFVRRGYARGLLDAGVPQQLHDASAVVMDHRTEDLPDADLRYIRANFSNRLNGPGVQLWVRNSR